MSSSILKLWDETTNKWISVSAIKGDKGESGVILSTTEPIDKKNNPIWIDENASGDELLTKKETLDIVGWITPEMFGAIGDGIVNDTDAFYESLNYAINNNVSLKLTKQYLINPLTKTGISCSNKNISIIGEGLNKIIAIPSNSSKYIFAFHKANIINISGVNFESDMTIYEAIAPETNGEHISNGAKSSNVTAIYISKGYDTKITNCIANGCHYFASIQNGVVEVSENGDVVISNCKSLNGGGMGVYADNFNKMTIDNFELTRQDKICGGMHVVYTSGYWTELRINNITYLPQNQIIDYDFTVFNLRNAHDEIYEVGNSYITNCNIKCTSTILSIRNESENVYVNDCTFENIETTKSKSVIRFMTDMKGKTIFNNCNIINLFLSTGSSHNDTDYKIEFNNCNFIESCLQVSSITCGNVHIKNSHFICSSNQTATSPIRTYGDRTGENGVSVILENCLIDVEYYYAPLSNTIRNLVVMNCTFNAGETSSDNSYMFAKLSNVNETLFYHNLVNYKLKLPENSIDSFKLNSNGSLG